MELGEMAWVKLTVVLVVLHPAASATFLALLTFPRFYS